MTSKLKDMLAGSVKTGDFTLASGKKSGYYIDIKKVYTDPAVLKEIVREMAELVRKREVDKISGIALGAIPIAAVLSLELGIPFLMVRKDKKGHGTDVQIEGGLKEGDRVIMVEDVTTTGASVVAGVEEVRKKGICDTVLVAVDREEGALELLKEHGVELISLVTVRELIGGD
jgi:orotate phosphoribosyltransferase